MFNVLGNRLNCPQLDKSVTIFILSIATIAGIRS